MRYALLVVMPFLVGIGDSKGCFCLPMKNEQGAEAVGSEDPSAYRDENTKFFHQLLLTVTRLTGQVLEKKLELPESSSIRLLYSQEIVGAVIEKLENDLQPITCSYDELLESSEIFLNKKAVLKELLAIEGKTVPLEVFLRFLPVFKME